MGDAFGLMVAGLACLVAFVVRTVRADARAGTSTMPGTGGWLLVAAAVVSIVSGVLLAATRLFSG